MRFQKLFPFNKVSLVGFYAHFDNQLKIKVIADNKKYWYIDLFFYFN